jgi:hypothetical protein
MAYTLAQYANLEVDPTKKYVMRNLLREMKVAEYLPFTTINALRTAAYRWSLLPSVAFRDLNGTYTEDTSGNVDQVWESLYILGGELDFDRVFGKVSGGAVVDPYKLQVDMKLVALALKFNDQFINGDLASDPLGFEGLKKRISLMPSRQKVCVTTTAATSLDVTSSAANVALFWKGVEKAYEYCNRGQVNLIVCNEDMKMGLGSSLRYINAAGGNFLDVSKDSFDRAVVTYKGTPIVDIGLKADQSTEIITDTETDADSTHSVSTSMYFASFNEQQGVIGIQLGPVEVIPNAEKDVATVDKTLIEWVVGLAGFGSYGVTRLWNILAPDTWTA